MKNIHIEPMRHNKENRKEERVAVAHVVRIGDSRGITHDISASGVYFESVVPFTIGETIDFAVEMGRYGVDFLLSCYGEIVRVDNLDGKIGIAVKIIQSVLESAH